MASRTTMRLPRSVSFGGRPGCGLFSVVPVALNFVHRSKAVDGAKPADRADCRGFPVCNIKVMNMFLIGHHAVREGYSDES